MIAPIALAVPAAASASPSAIDEYKLNLPGGQGNAHKANSQEASDGNSAVVPILIGAGVVLTGGAVFMLARKRRQET